MDGNRPKQESYNKALLLLNVISSLSEETVCVAEQQKGKWIFFFFFLVKQLQVLLKASSELFTSAAMPLRPFHLKTRCSENNRNLYSGFI